MPLFALALGPVPPVGDEVARFLNALPFYDAPPQEWSDGRCTLWLALEDPREERLVAAGGGFTLTLGVPGSRGAVLRYDGNALDVETDPLGSYPLYRGGEWISNSPALAGRLSGAGGAGAEAALASIVGGGWSLSGDPPIAGVRRIAPEVEFDLEQVREWLRGPIDVAGAARALTETVTALADLPGRRNVVPLSGGRDSRLVFAAALGRFDFEVRTGGGEADPDVVVARELCARAGVEHQLMDAPAGGDRWSDPAHAARVLWGLTGGTATLANGAGFPVARWGRDRPLWHSGQGGELARRVVPDLPERGTVDVLLERFLGRRPGRPDLLTSDAVALVREELASFIDETREAGLRTEDLPDAYYLRKRMGTWAGPTHAAVEPVRDVTSPLWSRRMLPFMLSGTPDDRRRERLHRALVAELAPALVDVGFQDGTRWTGQPRLHRQRVLAGKVRRELRRRLAQRRATPPPAGGPPPEDPRGRLMAQVRAAIDRSNPAHAVLDPRRVDALLALPPAALDDWREQQVWRLATLFLR